MKKNSYFSKMEWILLLVSFFVIITFFCVFDRTNFLSLFSSLIGVTSLIFNAKANPIGQALMIIFSILYGIISYSFSYYGEMITYLGMTAPMAVLALFSWLKNPYNGNKSQVKINKKLTKMQISFMIFLSILVTIIFYFILSALRTANVFPSTISVTTSFLAVYLTFLRSPFFALWYAINDIILIILWFLATIESVEYLSVMICFVVFLINDIYGFINWRKIAILQNRAGEK